MVGTSKRYDIGSIDGVLRGSIIGISFKGCLWSFRCRCSGAEYYARVALMVGKRILVFEVAAVFNNPTFRFLLFSITLATYG
jgi:hypothetical protein